MTPHPCTSSPRRMPSSRQLPVRSWRPSPPPSCRGRKVARSRRGVRSLAKPCRRRQDAFHCQAARAVQPLREQGLLRGGARRARLRRSAGRPGGARGVREKAAGGRASPSCECGQGPLRATVDARGAQHSAGPHDSGLAVAAATKPEPRDMTCGVAAAPCPGTTGGCRTGNALRHSAPGGPRTPSPVERPEPLLGPHSLGQKRPKRLPPRDVLFGQPPQHPVYCFTDAITHTGLSRFVVVPSPSWP